MRSQPPPTAERNSPGTDSPVKQALRAVKDLQAKLHRLEAEPVAIIGMGCRFPGGIESPDSFWQLLRERRDAVGEVPPDRWPLAEFYDPAAGPGKIRTRFGGFLKGADEFAAGFFGISPREAACMDPQQRLLLEVSWEALEHAACAPASLRGAEVGVFVGICNGDYYQRLTRRGYEAINPYLASGNAHSVAAGRLAFFHDFRGPVLAIDTACSSSLVAVHEACRSLRSGDCRLALAGGVNLLASPEYSITFSGANMLAPDGRCKTFDAAADGYVRAEGCGVVVLKRLSDAVRDRDQIWAVVAGSAVNHDGHTSGLTVPNGPAQQAVIERALRNAGLRPEQITFIEAHGTGTSLGDPIEVRALNAVFAPGRPAGSPLWIGSVKTNFGHAEGAAGIAGLIKAALALHHRQLPGHLHFQQPSPEINWSEGPARVSSEGVEFRSGEALHAGVSSFGFSGTNAHVVLSAPPARTVTPPAASDGPHLFPLSAGSPVALQRLAARHRDHLAAASDSLADLCFSASAGRSHFSERRAWVVNSAAELQARLAEFAAAPEAGAEGSTMPGGAKLAFMFTGQGADFAGAGRQLYESLPVFRRELDRCQTILASLLPQPLVEVLFSENAAEWLRSSRLAQPAIFAFEYALAQVWQIWGVRPAVVLGHSLGEYVAACVAGVFSLEDGLRLVAERGRLVDELPAGGRMLAVFRSAAEVRAAIALLGGDVSVAAINAPELTVVSGGAEPLEQLRTDLGQRGWHTQFLETDFAFHSRCVEPMLAAFGNALATVTFHAPQLALVSNLTGQLAGAEIATPAYWLKHLREEVRFAEGLRMLAGGGVRQAIEIGPQPVLCGLAKRGQDLGALTCVPSLRRGVEERSSLLETLAEVYRQGGEVEWAALHADTAAYRVSLPTYPFERESFWVELGAARRPHETGASPRLLGGRVSSPLAVAQFETVLALPRLGCLADHRINGAIIVPASVFVELMLEAAGESGLGDEFELRDIELVTPLSLAGENACLLQTVVSPAGEGGHSINIHSRPAADAQAPWVRHAGAVRVAGRRRRTPRQGEALGAAGDLAALYEGFKCRGVEFGPGFRLVRSLYREADGVVAELDPGTAPPCGGVSFLMHPALLDAACHGVGLLLPEPESGWLFIQSGMASVVFHGGGVPVRSRIARHHPTEADPDSLHFDVTLSDAQGASVLEISGLRLRRTRAERVGEAGSPGPEAMYDVEWQLANSAPGAGGFAAGTVDRLPVALAGAASRLAGSTFPFAEALVSLEHTAAGFAWTAVREALAGRPGQARFTADELAQWLGVVESRRRLLVRLLEILSTHGRLRSQDGGWEVMTPPVGLAVSPGGAQQFACASHEFELLERCGRALPAVLRGADPIPWLFPTDGSATVELIYRAAPGAQSANMLAGEAVKELLRDRPAPARLRVLEAGGGTGSTTAVLLPLLAGHCAEYCFTDVTPHFLGRARERFGGHDFFKTSVFDLEASPGRQTLALNSYDLIVAANVVHATRAVATSLVHLRELLKPGGVLLLVESTERRAWVDLIFGLTDGWWRFTDAAWRPDYPLLKGPQWQAVLADCGYDEAIAFVPDRPEMELLAGQALVLAHKPLLAARPTKTWLICAGREGLGEALGRSLEQAGDRCLYAVSARALRRVEERRCELAWDDTEHWRQMLAGWPGPPVDEVLHLGVPAVAPGEFDDIPPEAGLQQGCGSLLLLIQALAERPVPPRLTVVTAGATSVQPRLDPAAAATWGLARTAMIEHPELAIRLVDFDGGEVAAFAQHLREDAPAGQLEQLQSFHSGRLWVPRLRQLRLGATGAQFQLKAGPAACYLVSGGTRSMGLRVAEWLAGHGAGHLILLGRTAPPPESEARIKLLRERHIDVQCVAADVADLDQMRGVLRGIAARGLKLRGVIHAAGIYDDRLIRDHRWNLFEEVFRPKARGAWNLHHLTRDCELDFFVLFSSMAAMLGNAGLANYVAANSFLDQLAHYRRARSLPALSINWGIWRGVGMASNVGAKRRQQWETQGLRLLEPEAALAALAAMLAGEVTQAGVMAIEWPAFLAQFEGEGVPTLFRNLIQPDALLPAPSAVDWRARLRAAPKSEHLALLQQQVRAQVAAVLGIRRAETIRNDKGFFDQGMDSLTAVDFRNRLQAVFQCRLAPTVAYKHATVAALAEHLAAELLPGDLLPSTRPVEVGRTPEPMDPARPGLEQELDALADDELAALLSARLSAG